MSLLPDLTKLTDADFAELAEQVVLEQERRSRSTDVERYQQLVHELICKELGERVAPPQRLAHYSKFKANVGWLADFIRRHFKPTRRNEWLAGFRLAVTQSARALRVAQAPLTHKTLSLKLRYFNDVVDRQFPGYRESGLLPYLLRHDV